MASMAGAGFGRPDRRGPSVRLALVKRQHVQPRASTHLRASEVRVVIVGGLPATGKSTLAAALGDALGWVAIMAYGVRKELSGFGSNPAPAEFGEGIYRSI